MNSENRYCRCPSPSSEATIYRDLEDTPANSQLSVMYTRDWRSALRTPPTYRIGNRTLRFNFHFALLLAGVCALFFIFLYVRPNSSSSSDTSWIRNIESTPYLRSSSSSNIKQLPLIKSDSSYDDKYPLTSPVVARRSGTVTFRIAMVADLDVSSKVGTEESNTIWRSFMKKGHLIYVGAKNEVIIKWDRDEPVKLDSSYSLKGRGMELSELVTFNGRLLSFDDRTGIIYEIEKDRAIPWVILLDGDGHNAKGFKAEWATVKEHVLYVGSMGKEWTTATGDFENENPMFVKAVLPTGEVHSLDWSLNYKMLRQESEHISWPGYMIHESGVWSDKHQKWYFLPRRCSTEKYNETRDEHMGCNVLIAADDHFSKVETVTLETPNKTPTHGFSSFKFIPGTEDHVIVALKTEELNGKTATFITAFDVDGKTLLPEQRVETDLKYEGIEFI